MAQDVNISDKGGVCCRVSTIEEINIEISDPEDERNELTQMLENLKVELAHMCSENTEIKEQLQKKIAEVTTHYEEVVASKNEQLDAALADYEKRTDEME